MGIPEIIVAIFILCLVVPIMAIMAMAGPWGIFMDVLLLLISSPFIYMWFLSRKIHKRKEMEMKEIREHSTPITAWEGSKATLIERTNRPVELNMRISLQFCPHLIKLGSLMIKCPECQYIFPRFLAKSDAKLTHSEYSSLKSGELSLTEILRRQIRKDGCPSTFRCPKCSAIIVRSREPSGMCQLYGKRVYGEKLFCCTINQCI